MSKIKNIISWIIIVSLSLTTNLNTAFAFSQQQPQPSKSVSYQEQEIDFETQSGQDELPLDPQNQWDMLIYNFVENLQREQQLINEINQIIRQINAEFNLDENDERFNIY